MAVSCGKQLKNENKRRIGRINLFMALGRVS
jgi:hypothetical protein